MKSWKFKVTVKILKTFMEKQKTQVTTWNFPKFMMKVVIIYHARGLAVLFISKRFAYREFSLSSTRSTPSTWAEPLAPSFIVVDNTWCHNSELSKITGIFLDIRSKSYKESIAQEVAIHLEDIANGFRFASIKIGCIDYQILFPAGCKKRFAHSRQMREASESLRARM